MVLLSCNQENGKNEERFIIIKRKRKEKKRKEKKMPFDCVVFVRGRKTEVPAGE